jgi:hypothetical protein
MNIQRARKSQETILETAVQEGLDMECRYSHKYQGDNVKVEEIKQSGCIRIQKDNVA